MSKFSVQWSLADDVLRYIQGDQDDVKKIIIPINTMILEIITVGADICFWYCKKTKRDRRLFPFREFAVKMQQMATAQKFIAKERSKYTVDLMTTFLRNNFEDMKTYYQDNVSVFLALFTFFCYDHKYGLRDRDEDKLQDIFLKLIAFVDPPFKEQLITEVKDFIYIGLGKQQV